MACFPPTLNFKKPNPKFDLENSPFYVNPQRTEWKSEGKPRRAGVSAFGVGGTNAHVILEQAPSRPGSPSTQAGAVAGAFGAHRSGARSRHRQSGQTPRSFAKPQPGRCGLDAASRPAQFRLPPQRGRQQRRGSRDRAGAARPQKSADAPGPHRQARRLVSVSRPGFAARQHGAGDLPDRKPVFRAAVDRCAEILLPHLGADLRTLLYPPDGVSDEAKKRVTDTIIAQPAIFTIEYALAQLWMSWGIRPQAMLGHSIGEFVAACLAGVFSLEDALQLVATRGQLMQDLPAGGMLSVRLPEAEVRTRLQGTAFAVSGGAELAGAVRGRRTV